VPSAFQEPVDAEDRFVEPAATSAASSLDPGLAFAPRLPSPSRRDAASSFATA